MLLLDRGADINLQNVRQETALHIAARKCSSRILELLLAKGAEVNIQGKGGNTPLHIIAKNNYKNLIKTLLENGADPNITNNQDNKPIDLTSRHGIKVLLQTKMQEIVNYRGEGFDDNVLQPPVNSLSNSQQSYEEDKLQHLNINQLLIAIKFGNLDKVKHILKHNAALLNEAMLRLNLLNSAAFHGRNNIIEFLMNEYGCEVFAKNEYGYTALHHAAFGGQLTTVKWLTSIGLDVLAEDCDGKRPINYTQNPEVFQFLDQKMFVQQESSISTPTNNYDQHNFPQATLTPPTEDSLPSSQLGSNITSSSISSNNPDEQIVYDVESDAEYPDSHRKRSIDNLKREEGRKIDSFVSSLFADSLPEDLSKNKRRRTYQSHNTRFI